MLPSELCGVSFCPNTSGLLCQSPSTIASYSAVTVPEVCDSPTASTKISPPFCMSELHLAGLGEKDFYCRRFSFQSERVNPTTWRNKRVCLPKLMSLRGHRIASSKPDSQGSVCPSNIRHVYSLHMTYCGAKEGTEPQCMSEIFSFCCNGFFVSMLQPCN